MNFIFQAQDLNFERNANVSIMNASLCHRGIYRVRTLLNLSSKNKSMHPSACACESAIASASDGVREFSASETN